MEPVFPNEHDREIVTSQAIDMAYDGGLRETLRRIEQEYDVRLLVVNRQSDGGGWPEVTITGERWKVARCIRTAWDCGDDFENEWLVEQMVP